LASAWGRTIGVNTSRGDLSFLCVIAGFNAEELTPKYPDFISERVYALGDATRWWHEYGKEALLLKDV
jgi:hypothetical protein